MIDSEERKLAFDLSNLISSFANPVQGDQFSTGAFSIIRICAPIQIAMVGISIGSIDFLD